MRVLITGGLGFIGTNLAIECLSKGWQVVIVDNGKQITNQIRKSIIQQYGSPKIYQTSVKNFVITNKYKDFDVVFHLAALPSVLYSIEQPLKSFKNNVTETTLMLLTEAKDDANIRRIVFASSAAVYGNACEFPIREDAIKNPISPYGMHKLHGEQILRIHGRLKDIDTVSLRYFNVYGPYQLSNGPYATVVSAWLHNIKDNLPLRKDGSGEQTRDMVYVQDIVKANILAAEYADTFNGDAINIASGSEISNNQILEMLSTKFKFSIQQAPFRPGDILKTHPCIEKSRRMLNFQPEYNFSDGLEKTIKSIF